MGQRAGIKSIGWKTVRLGEIAEIVAGGTPSTDDLSYWNGNIPWITPKDLSGFDGVWIESGSRNISKQGLDNSSARLLPRNTVLFSSRAPIGYVAIAANSISTNQGFKNVICDEKNTHYRFIYYWLKRHGKSIEKQASGATFGEANAALMKSLQLNLPTLKEQKAIAAVLSSLDDKIELLQKQNTTLERIAQAIFKEWFVQFNFPDKNSKPYKTSGGKMVDSELGPIPEGWQVEPVGKMVRCVGGSTPSTKEIVYWSGGTHPFVTPKDLSSLTSPIIFKPERYITDAGVDTISSGQLPAGTILLSSRAPIGYLAFAGVPVSINQGIIAMICDGALPKEYIFHWVQSNMGQIKGNASGTTFDEISKSNFRPIPAVVPKESILTQYVRAVAPLNNKIASNVRQCATLTDIRNRLLHKLISGQLRVITNK